MLGATLLALKLYSTITLHENINSTSLIEQNLYANYHRYYLNQSHNNPQKKAFIYACDWT
ncbi:hypothetical protein GCM10009409_25820 [Shewanella saliphila]|uniref:Uncharacterized protein n=1 Tax=Shewanella saliphila TaxID=2282698 RepID=A0ABQ2Q8K9_9GAMM|nr:hypothetical protein GCM10009409_25820 [Shewanella saliphila]